MGFEDGHWISWIYVFSNVALNIRTHNPVSNGNCFQSYAILNSLILDQNFCLSVWRVICYCFPIQNKLVLCSNANGNCYDGLSGFGKSWVFTLFPAAPQLIIRQERWPHWKRIWSPASFWQESMCPCSCENLGKLTKNKSWRSMTYKALWLESNFFQCGPVPSPTHSSEFIVNTKWVKLDP